MSEHRYCLQQDVLSVYTPDQQHKGCLYVPAGAVVSVDAVRENDKFVKARWNSKTVLMFLQDIQDRGELL